MNFTVQMPSLPVSSLCLTSQKHGGYVLQK
nr:MAG TPA: hypothetical protein [Caudoviricetes sp.]